MTVTVEPSGEGRPPTTAPVAASVRAVPRPAVARDRFLDALRLFVMVLVVVQHWWLPVLTVQSEGQLAASSVLSAPGGFALTWVSQVMPLIFFVGGAANLISWRSASARGETASVWWAKRLRRLAWPVVPLAVVWILACHVAVLAGAPEQPVLVGAGAAGMVLWFLAAYVLVVVATPVLVAAHDRFGWWVPAALITGAVAVDLSRFGFGVEAFGFLNVAFVWLAVHQLGFLYGTGAIRRSHAAWMIAVGAVTAVVLVYAGPYSMNMTGVFAAETSNVAPPTLVLAALGAVQVGVAMLLRDRISAWSDRPGVARMLDWVSPQLMTVYLWHMLPITVVAGVVVYGLGINTPDPMTGLWLLWGVLGMAVLLPLVLPLANWAVRFENPPKVLKGDPGPVRVLAAAALIGGGLLALTVAGLGFGLAPVLGLVAVVSGLLLTAAPRVPRAAASRPGLRIGLPTGPRIGTRAN
ncbi:acyltransferase family protein [Nocardiopsis ganjiahuensis]|uniref:acyltransferase family protein n=1 Tax=Nocardiopsis ganjiahuensis TaxID=239984 RepID=UPI0003482C03|nr:acyltransferase [Nocardiopsis ganjiahuensis]